jgi:hypothetical protein
VEFSFFKEEKTNDSVVVDIQSESLTNEEKEELNASAAVSVRENEEKKGIYKNIDLYKMHAYKDAIRRSGGAYILYPGSTEAETNFQGFHEIIPGVGAFALRPNNEGIASKNIEQFIEKVIANLEDVLSQRERMARTASKVYEHSPMVPIQDGKLDKLIRELGKDGNIGDTNVLIGYYKSKEHLEWIKSNFKYNVRYGANYTIDGKMITAQFLVLYGNSEFEQTYIYPIHAEKGRIVSKKELLELKPKKYPSNPSSDQYFIFDIDKPKELDPFVFDKGHELLKDRVAQLEKLKMPFTITLWELAQIRK